MAKRRNIFLIGPMGAGKSTIGRELARMLKMEFFDSDHEIEARTGADIAWIFDIEGEAGFRKREKEVIDDLTKKNNIVLATGGGVVTTPENCTALAARGVVVYLFTSLEQQYKRTRHDAKRPLLHTDNVKEKIDQLWEEREPLYTSIADLHFDTDSHTVKSVATKIIDTLDKLT